jgi:DNA-binding NarL/FixJ family response regulator
MMLDATTPAAGARLAPPRLPPKDPQATSEPMQKSTETRETPRILIVEDDFLIAMQTEAALREAGFDVIGPATTAEEAIAFAIEDRPFLVVMDIRLASQRDGIDAARELFQDLAIRCIFATAHDDAHTRERAEPYAPLGWLAKPYTMMTLIASVSAALDKL